MNMKNSKKIVPATVFAAIIVLLAFAVMSTTGNADGKSLEETVIGPSDPKIGTEEAWVITMRVTNNFGYTMTDTKVTENFAGDLKIDFVALPEINYTFEYNDTNYGTNEATVDIYDDYGGPYTWNVDETGITIPEGNIHWTGLTHKAHVTWTIGVLESGESQEVTIGVSTDTNPAGEQQYTKIGKHELNSGATLKFIDNTGMQHSEEVDPTVVMAE